MKYIVWTLFVWVPVTAVAANISSGATQLGTGFIVALVLLVGLPIYVIGLVAMWWRDMGRWSG
jgi:hypothetical protein